jgi:hypothetical protein
MAVGGAVHIWACSMDCRMDHVRSSVEKTALAAINDLARVVDELYT